MAFKITPIKTLSVNVTFDEPADVGKKAKKCDFTVTFIKRTVSEKQEVLDKLKQQRKNELEDDDAEPLIQDEDVLATDIVTIDGLRDENDNPVEYNLGVLDQLLEMDYVREPLMEQWMNINISKRFVKALKAKN